MQQLIAPVSRPASPTAVRSAQTEGFGVQNQAVRRRFLNEKIRLQAKPVLPEMRHEREAARLRLECERVRQLPRQMLGDVGLEDRLHQKEQ